ncbi:MAG TPA: phospholipase D-like domain-containing protein [Acetobacteraceae bacterium]|nr:phospholipase D-like domain-containing protein [Acetobacteraceae bacterium]
MPGDFLLVRFGRGNANLVIATGEKRTMSVKSASFANDAIGAMFLIQEGGVTGERAFSADQLHQAVTVGTHFADFIGNAKSSLRLSGPIMGAILDRMHRVGEFGGIFDGPEMEMILKEWSRSGHQKESNATAQRRSAASSAKAEQFEQIAQFLHRKDSLPYKASGLHNFMHNKFAVIDDAVVTGSFNFSTNAQRNAENVVVIRNKEIAASYAQYVI